MSYKICIIGLGYVGLPLAHAFSKKYETIGIDINQTRVDELNNAYDKTLELNETQLKEAINNCIKFTTNIDDIKKCNVYIITVPTPIDKNKRPNLTPLLKSSETIGKILKKNDIVIYESTVYPGVTEDECVPVLEKFSNMKFNRDFFCGYSPERINPGDKEHTVTNIVKVISGSTPKIGKKIDALYSSIITAGTHLAPTIRVAEASKIIENSQRDINIAFVNELALIFNKLGIDTNDVLEAAFTKWNFLPYKPGLVGGHCIGVDPYYLAHKAQEVGYNPEIILAGRRLNDNMGIYVANQVVKLMIKNGYKVDGSKVLVLGITFKENCPDIRNSKVIDIIQELQEFGCQVDVHDPWANKEEVKREYGINLIKNLTHKQYGTSIIAVAHDEFKSLDINRIKNGKDAIIYDLKSVLNSNEVNGRL
ncbi:MAG: nucleotide sugar dehydrogenase [Sulfurospirillum sp.]|nr:nucleotide sugar dehydrogenase [Sulfurospirillum sp.]